MSIMGLDLGEKTIGVAVSDPLEQIALGVGVIRRQGRERDLQRLAAIAREKDVTLVVLGLPRNMNGTLGERAEATLAFARHLEERLGLPVVTQDERLSTVAAEKALLEADLSRRRRREVIDMTAAVIILQGFLDGRRVARNQGV